MSSVPPRTTARASGRRIAASPPEELAIGHTGEPPLRIVLVDDDARFRATARRALAAEGVDVVAEVSDGGLVSEVVERWHPDVVLVDIRMPGVDGLEVARRLRRQVPTVILMSTVDEAYGRQLAVGLADGYLPKHDLSLAAIRRFNGPPEGSEG